jgi:hypothetical protein
MNPAPPPFDPAQAAIQIAMALLQALGGQIQGAYQQVIMWATGQDFLLTTGAGVSFQQPLIIRFWQTNVLAADGALALVIVWIGYNVMLGLYEPLSMMSRVILAAVAIHASLQFIGLFIQLNNALCASAILTAGLPQVSDLAALLGFPVIPNAASGVVIVQTIIIFALSMTIILQELVRLALLDLLIVLSPFALLLYISPSTQKWANLWSTAFFATLFVQFLQVSAIAVGAALVANIATTFSVVAALAGIGILVFVLKIPGWLGSAVTGAIAGVNSPAAYAAAAARQATQSFLMLVRR